MTSSKFDWSNTTTFIDVEWEKLNNFISFFVILKDFVVLLTGDVEVISIDEEVPWAFSNLELEFFWESIVGLIVIENNDVIISSLCQIN